MKGRRREEREIEGGKEGEKLSLLFLTQSIKRVVDRRTVDLFVMFNDELNLVKKEFNRQSPSLTPFQPQYAGRATWARSLKKRIDTPMKVHIVSLLYLITIGT